MLMDKPYVPIALESAIKKLIILLNWAREEQT